jgi:carbonyl reductase 1
LRFGLFADSASSTELLKMKRVLITGGNSGIGFALARQLAQEDHYHVYLGARTLEKASKAVESILSSSGGGLAIEPLAIDPGSDESVSKAALLLQSAGVVLYGLVNNAGTGFKHNSTGEEILNVNSYGPKRVTEAFLNLLDTKIGRVVMVGSGSAGAYVKQQGPEVQKLLCNVPSTWSELEAHIEVKRSDPAFMAEFNPGPYGLSKAILAAYTMLLAKEHPNITFSCCSPGFIQTKLTEGFGATKTPEEGTLSIRHCLNQELKGNGYYYGSDALRSPYHFTRDPGTEEYNGVPPY